MTPPNDAASDLEQPQRGDIPSQTPDESDGLSNNQPAGRNPVDDRQPAEPQSDPISSKQESSLQTPDEPDGLSNDQPAGKNPVDGRQPAEPQSDPISSKQESSLQTPDEPDGLSNDQPAGKNPVDGRQPAESQSDSTFPKQEPSLPGVDDDDRDDDRIGPDSVCVAPDKPPNIQNFDIIDEEVRKLFHPSGFLAESADPVPVPGLDEAQIKTTSEGDTNVAEPERQSEERAGTVRDERVDKEDAGNPDRGDAQGVQQVSQGTGGTQDKPGDGAGLSDSSTTSDRPGGDSEVSGQTPGTDERLADNRDSGRGSTDSEDGLSVEPGTTGESGATADTETQGDSEVRGGAAQQEDTARQEDVITEPNEATTEKASSERKTLPVQDIAPENEAAQQEDVTPGTENTPEEAPPPPKPHPENEPPPESNEPVSHTDGDASEGELKSPKQPEPPKRKPPQMPGRRNRRSGHSQVKRRQSPSSRPELVCREIPGSRGDWEVVLSVDEQCPVEEVRFNDELLDGNAGQYHLPSLEGSLTIRFPDGQEPYDIPLFSEGSPLIFKLSKNWKGEGRSIKQITKGHFIVIAPKQWRRKGNAPVESGGCANDEKFQAHYCYQDEADDENAGCRFDEWNASPAQGIKLTGRHIFDDSDEGMLFVNASPNLEPLPQCGWARVGEETKDGKNGWAKDFQLGEKSLSEVLSGREGRFFLRVYDSQTGLRFDSTEFRYLRDLQRISVNGAEYNKETVLIPEEGGYPDTEVSLIGTDGSRLIPERSPEAPQTVTSSGVIRVPPHPGADRLELSVGAVNIIINLPRIWWRLSGDDPVSSDDPGKWRDQPFKMTRREFQGYAYSDVNVCLHLPQGDKERDKSVSVGFDGEWSQTYKREIPLSHFADHTQIRQRLNIDAYFNIEWAGQELRLIRILADPMPEITSFTAQPEAIPAGGEVTLSWTTCNADDIRMVIEPAIGAVKSNGTRTVRPAATTQYRLKLDVPGDDVVSCPVTVIVDPPSRPGRQKPARDYDEYGRRRSKSSRQRAAQVKYQRKRWRAGKGFSLYEIREAGLTVEQVAARFTIDRRRRTSHPCNIETIRNVFRNILDG